jgi:hypothetical protein
LWIFSNFILAELVCKNTDNHPICITPEFKILQLDDFSLKR